MAGVLGLLCLWVYVLTSGVSHKVELRLVFCLEVMTGLSFTLRFGKTSLSSVIFVTSCTGLAFAETK